MTPQGVARDAVAGDSVRIDLPFEINFDLNFGVKPEMSDSLSLFLGVRHLPQSYIDDGEAPMLTLKPYNCFTRYDEDPIHWQTMAGMMILPRAVASVSSRERASFSVRRSWRGAVVMAKKRGNKN